MMCERMNMLIAGTAIWSVVFAGVALAASEPAGLVPAVKQAKLLERFGDQGIDADGDDVLTPEEVKAFFADKHCRGAAGVHGPKGGQRHGMGAWFNHGMKHVMHHGMIGRMDYEEMTEAQRAKMLEHHPEADGDEDGMLSEAEFEAFRAQRMEQRRAKVLKHHPEADSDEDGVLSEAEFEAFHAQRMEERRARMLEHHPEADTDGDGTLSEDEARVFLGDHHGGCAGHEGKEHGWCAHNKDEGHGGCAHHEGRGPGGHAGHRHRERVGCAEGQ